MHRLRSVSALYEDAGHPFAPYLLDRGVVGGGNSRLGGFHLLHVNRPHRVILDCVVLHKGLEDGQLTGLQHGKLYFLAGHEFREFVGGVLLLAGGENSDILAADNGSAAAFVGGNGRGNDALCFAVIIGAEVPGAFKEHSVFAVDAVPRIHGAVHITDGEDLLVVQLDQFVHGGDAGVAVQIAGRLCKAVVGQRAAKQPEVGVHIPVADAGNVQTVGAAILGRFDEGFHRLGNIIQTNFLQHVLVDDCGLAVGVQRQAVILALVKIGGQGRVQIIAGDLRDTSPGCISI